MEDINCLISTTTYTIDDLRKFPNGANALFLYFEYIKHSRIQKTNQAWCLDVFMKKSLGWGDDRFRDAKKVLQTLGLIEVIQKKLENGKFGNVYIKINFMVSGDKRKKGFEPEDGKTEVGEIRSADFPKSDFQDTNALEENKILKEQNKILKEEKEMLLKEISTFKKISNFENSSLLENQKEKEDGDFSKENEIVSSLECVPPRDLTIQANYFEGFEKINSKFNEFLNLRKIIYPKLKTTDLAINNQKRIVGDLIIKYRDENKVCEIIENCIIKKYQNICDLGNKITTKQETGEIQEIKETLQEANDGILDLKNSKDLEKLLEKIKSHKLVKNGDYSIKDFLNFVLIKTKELNNQFYSPMIANPGKLADYFGEICQAIFQKHLKENRQIPSFGIDPSKEEEEYNIFA